MFKQKRQVKQNLPRNLVAPLAGLNALSPLMALRENEAILMENFFPAADGLALRQGFVEHATASDEPVDRLWVYSQPTGGEQLFATTDSGIYDVSSAGAFGSAVSAITSGETIASAISTGAGSYLYFVNGVDDARHYNGTTWTTVATFGTVDTDTLSYVETYRQRLYFVKKNSLELEYLGANSISGTSTNYPLGAIFRRGGYIVALGTWTIDGGTGPEDNLVVLTSEGEVAVFAGSLPSDTSLWSERGVYYIAKPLGKQPLLKWGGDLLILTENGIYPLSSAIQSAAIDRVSALSEKIKPLFNTAAGLYRAEEGWQMIVDPLQPFLLANIPSTPVRKQFIMNTQTKAWTTFVGWDSRCYARKGAELYFGTATGVNRITGVNDNGANIVGTLLQAPSRLGLSQKKKIELLKPYVSQNNGFTYTLGLAPDLGDPKEYTMITGAGSATAAIWGTARFGSAYWTGQTGISQDWQTVPDDYSTWKSFYLSITTNVADIRYFGSDLLMLPGGNL
jgi:hypothetical protein